MKTIFTALFFILATTIFAQTDCAQVRQKNGLKIYIYSTPGSYKSLGTVKKKFALTGQPKEMIEAIISKVQKEYPGANAILFTSDDLAEAEAIVVP